MPKEAEIKFLVKLDDTGAPEEIYWNATDSGEEGFAPCESLMISMWDKSARNRGRRNGRSFLPHVHENGRHL